MIGSYYETHAVSPIGIGAVEQTMADVANATVQGLLAAVQPLVIVIPWATEDGSFWVPALLPEVRYALYPVDAQLLDAVKTAAFGQPLGFVAVFDTVMRASPESLFEGTPWEYFQSQAIFSERDGGDPPVIRFLYWAKLRDEATSRGTAATLEAKVKAVGAVLVYPATLPIEGAARAMPTTPFDTALRASTATSPAKPPVTTASTTSPYVTAPAIGPSAPESTSSGWGGLLLLTAVAAVGGYAAFRIARGR